MERLSRLPALCLSLRRPVTAFPHIAFIPKHSFPAKRPHESQPQSLPSRCVSDGS